MGNQLQTGCDFYKHSQYILQLGTVNISGKETNELICLLYLLGSHPFDFWRFPCSVLLACPLSVVCFHGGKVLDLFE